MNASNIESGPRALLPRWLPTNKLEKEDENSLQEPSSALSNNLSEHIRDWKNDENASSAEALVAYSIAINTTHDPAVVDAAAFLQSHGNSRLSADHAGLILGKKQNTEANLEIAQQLASARRTTRRYPNSSLIWNDLAYFHCLTGNRAAARQAAVTGNHVASGTSIESLPFSRCMIHLGEPDIALQAIRSSLKKATYSSTVSTEMAISQLLGVAPTAIQKAHKLASSGNLSQTENARIKAALATEFVYSGADRKARKLLSKESLFPDENTLAQLVWLSRQLGLEIDPSSSGLEMAHEAVGRAAYHEKDYENCIKSVERWFEYQPFSVTAISFGSYVAGFLSDDHQRSLKLLERGQVVGAESFTVWNNSAFDYAKLDRLPEAAAAIHSAQRFSENESQSDVLEATKGLLKFRQGSLVEGENLYRGSIKGFMGRRDLRSASIASLMLAEELARSGNQSAIQIIDEAKKIADEGNHTRVLEAIGRIRKKALKGIG